MRPTFNDYLIAYLTLFSGLAISGVAVYYSVMGLMAIYPAAVIPIIVMGVVLEAGKLVATVWLKQNWKLAPLFLKSYVLPAVIVLMMITSLGVFGFLAKAHTDQNLVSGDVQAKISVFDEKIKIEKENIDANRKALKQMDEAVDQTMGRSTSEQGADKAVAVRRAQAKERARLQQEISDSQKKITTLNEQRAPVAAEVRKVDAEVGPIKYIAALFYGDNPDANLLERAVTWVTILIVTVLDPLAVVLLLASQFSFQSNRDRKARWIEHQKREAEKKEEPRVEEVPPIVEEPPEAGVPEETKVEAEPVAEKPQEPPKESEPVDSLEPGAVAPELPVEEPTPTPEVEQPQEKKLMYLSKPWAWRVPGATKVGPLVYTPEEPANPQEEPVQINVQDVTTSTQNEEQLITELAELIKTEQIELTDVPEEYRNEINSKLEELTTTTSYVQNEEQQESNLWSTSTSNINVDNREIKQEEYEELAKHHEEIIENLAHLIRTRTIDPTDVPPEYINEVKIRV